MLWYCCYFLKFNTLPPAYNILNSSFFARKCSKFTSSPQMLAFWKWFRFCCTHYWRYHVFRIESRTIGFSIRVEVKEGIRTSVWSVFSNLLVFKYFLLWIIINIDVYIVFMIRINIGLYIIPLTFLFRCCKKCIPLQFMILSYASCWFFLFCRFFFIEWDMILCSLLKNFCAYYVFHIN